MHKQSSSILRDALRGSPLFSSLEDRELDSLIEIGRVVRVEASAAILHRGEEPDRVCAIVSGRAKVVVNSAAGREMTLRLLEAGTVFGEIAVFDGYSRTASVFAETDLEILVIARDRFRSYVREHGALALALLDGMALKLRETSGQLEESVFLSTEERLARTLLRLASRYGEDDSKGFTAITLELAQEDIANLAGCVRESANRKLRVWATEEIIRFDKGRISILDHDALEEIASGLG